MNDTWIDAFDNYGKNNIPFFFIINFDLSKIEHFPLDSKPTDVLYKIGEIRNYHLPTTFKHKPLVFEKFPIDFQTYDKAFAQVKKEILYGNSFLLNLTFPTKIEMNYSLRDVFYRAHAKYKLWYKNAFTVFSPESFIKIKDGYIYSYPMKGTINANLTNAESILLNNIKELQEHYTIVDLIRNDLSTVASNVEVTKFRYIDRIKTNQKDLLQASTEIKGKIKDKYYFKIGSILQNLLPAGSICGAPKAKTCEIISENELDSRGFYTGIFGIFDGKNLDSAVAIRFIENLNGSLFFRSGGGITYQSESATEYQELIDKIYVPFS